VSEEANKAAVRRFYEEMWGRGNLAVADGLFAGEYHDLGLMQQLGAPVYAGAAE
jgi:hypothetical protein